VAAPGMTAAQAAGGEPGTREGAVLLDGFQRIVRAGGLKTAAESGGPKDGRQQRRNKALIKAKQAAEEPLRRIQIPLQLHECGLELEPESERELPPGLAAGRAGALSGGALRPVGGSKPHRWRAAR
jgi:hypothetical protein